MNNSPFPDRRLANTVTWHLKPPNDINMRLPENITKCVAYLGNEITDSTKQKKEYRGTGFFVSKESKKIPGMNFLFLVTAKHVADKLEYKNFYVRVNTHKGTSADIKCKVDNEWQIHPTDKAADVAVLPLGINSEHIDFLHIPSTMFLDEKTRTEKGIGAGDEVFIIGLFMHHIGNFKNLPIVRVGSIAMTPDERIFVKDFGEMESYLIEAHSIGGLSGSPVFTTDRGFPESSLFLMGLMHGHWQIDSETIIDEIEKDAGIKAKSNTGIAIVTPASKILDILNGAEIAKLCEAQEAEIMEKNSPIPD